MWRILAMCSVAAGLLACAGVTPQESLAGFDTETKAPECVRECTHAYSGCIQNASLSSGNRLIANDVIRACGGALRLCASTCPSSTGSDPPAEY